MKYLLLLMICISIISEVKAENNTHNKNNPSIKNFESFKQSVFKEPFKNGVYIVNGDTPIQDELGLSRFYYSMVARTKLLKTNREMKKIFDKNTLKNVKNSQSYNLSWVPSKNKIMLNDSSSHLKYDGVPKLTIDAISGKINIWNKLEIQELKYCISKSFGINYSKVVDSMIVATNAWMNTSIIRFIHINEMDDNCNENTPGVDFDIRPINVNGKYLARAFFPRYSRLTSNILIDRSALNLNPIKQLNLDGILRHELGHVLGLRHEHTRPESGVCFEDRNWVAYGNYDVNSVMHYPQCNGNNDWSLTLSYMDKKGISCLYGPPNGEVIDTKFCESLLKH